jgi:enoyl reductase
MPVAIAFPDYGPPEVLEPIQIAEPQAGAGEVRVRVRAAGVAPFDCRLRRGEFARARPQDPPHRLGNEFAGVVDQAGDDVDGLAPGAEVLGFTVAAAYAEVITVPASQVALKPAGLPWPVAAALPVAGQGAWSVVRQLDLGDGDTFLVHAAAGGIGTFAVQLARQRGARVIGTASPANHDYLRSLGAIPVSYGPGEQDRVRAVSPGGITAALDAIGGDAVPVSLRLGAPADRVVCLVGQEAAVAAYGIRPLAGERSAKLLALLAELAAQGDLTVPVTEFSLLDCAAAHRRVESGHGRGKTVLVIAH